jgi:hypothetical protein
MGDSSSRRAFILKLREVGQLSLALGVTFPGCGEKKTIDEKKQITGGPPVDPCEDLTGVSDSDRALRQKLGYVKDSPIEDHRCDNCNLFLPPTNQPNCGGCMLFKGPVYLSAYCTYWAPRV